MNLVEELKEINKLRDNGEISKDEADQRKYRLAREMEFVETIVEFDKGCTT